MTVSHDDPAQPTMRAMLESGRALIGPGLMLGSTAIAELAGFIDFDWIFIDTEDSTTSPSGAELEALIRTVRAAGGRATVRVAELQQHMINKALNAGAEAIWIPHVTSARECELAVQWSRYPPIGQRGAAPQIRATRYGLDAFGDYAARANSDTLVIPMVESVDALSRVAEIAAVPGIDMVCLGLFDLSVSMGLSRDAGFGPQAHGVVHPALHEAAERCVMACEAAGIFAATVAWNAAVASHWLDLGYRCLLFGSDVDVVRNGLLAVKAEIDTVARPEPPLVNGA